MSEEDRQRCYYSMDEKARMMLYNSIEMSYEVHWTAAVEEEQFRLIEGYLVHPVHVQSTYPGRTQLSQKSAFNLVQELDSLFQM